MKEMHFLSIACLAFLFFIAANDPAFAERDCTHQVVRSDGTISITTDCSASYTQTEAPGAENFRNAYFFRTIVNNLMDSVHWGMQNMKERLAEIFSSQDRSRQISADAREKEQEAMDAQQIKLQEQQVQLENLKDRQETAKEQQEAMQDRVQNR
jgi:hypothetical protein